MYGFSSDTNSANSRENSVGASFAIDDSLMAVAYGSRILHGAP